MKHEIIELHDVQIIGMAKNIAFNEAKEECPKFWGEFVFETSAGHIHFPFQNYETAVIQGGLQAGTVRDLWRQKAAYPYLSHLVTSFLMVRAISTLR